VSKSSKLSGSGRGEEKRKESARLLAYGWWGRDSVRASRGCGCRTPGGGSFQLARSAVKKPRKPPAEFGLEIPGHGEKG